MKSRKAVKPSTNTRYLFAPGGYKVRPAIRWSDLTAMRQAGITITAQLPEASQAKGWFNKATLSQVQRFFRAQGFSYRRKIIDNTIDSAIRSR